LEEPRRFELVLAACIWIVESIAAFVIFLLFPCFPAPCISLGVELLFQRIAAIKS
jgi:hypothetical protein